MPTDWSDDIVVSDLSDEPLFSEELGSVVERVESAGGAVPHVVLNLAGVTYLNSSNIAQLLRLRKAVTAGGRSLRLCSVSDEVWTLILATGLDKILRFAPDPMTALAGLQLEESGEA